MSKLILPRRKFLFMAPAIVASSSLMPGHSIAKFLERDIDAYYGVLTCMIAGQSSKPEIKQMTAHGPFGQVRDLDHEDQARLTANIPLTFKQERQFFAYYDPYYNSSGNDFNHHTKNTGIEEVTYERYKKIKNYLNINNRHLRG